MLGSLNFGSFFRVYFYKKCELEFRFFFFRVTLQILTLHRMVLPVSHHDASATDSPSRATPKTANSDVVSVNLITK